MVEDSPNAEPAAVSPPEDVQPTENPAGPKVFTVESKLGERVYHHRTDLSLIYVHA